MSWTINGRQPRMCSECGVEVGIRHSSDDAALLCDKCYMNRLAPRRYTLVGDIGKEEWMEVSS